MSTAVFEQLLLLNSAAEACHGLARSLIDRHGRPNDLHHANSARRYVSAAESGLRQLQNHLEEGRQVARGPAIELVREAVGLSCPPIFVEGVSWPTAHDAAIALAEAVARAIDGSIGGESTAEDYIESVQRLEQRLAPLDMPDIWGQIEQEYRAASQLVELDEETGHGNGAVAEKRYRPPPCPRCGKASKVQSKDGDLRKLKCQSCGHNFQRSINSN